MTNFAPLAALAAALLAACGGAAQRGAIRPPEPALVIDAKPAVVRGDLIGAPIKVSAWDSVAFKVHLGTAGAYGAQLGSLTGSLLCGLDIHYFKYATVGGANEPTTATAALMVPTGTIARCTGERPLVMYGHGSTLGRRADMSNISRDSDMGDEALMAATLYAARGYIVVAPNYAGHIESLLPATLSYHEIDARTPTHLLARDMPHYSSLSPALQAHFGAPEKSMLQTSYVTALQADALAHPCPVTSATTPLACAPAHPMRQAWLKNDLRTWTPTSSMLLCGGHADPLAWFANAELTAAYFKARGAPVELVTTLDVDSPATAHDPYARAKGTFSDMANQMKRNNINYLSSSNYHGTLAFVACGVAGRDFFDKF